jgi:6-phosphogluconolactonase (cycloisomerase 2 family)
MQPVRSLAGAAAVIAVAALATAGPAAARTHRFFGFGQADPGAVFVQSDALTGGNTVTAYERGADGTLSAAATYPTGGNGGQLAGSVVDHLASQNSLVYDARAGLLFAVNAGSNTVTEFAVSGDRLRRLQIVDSGGVFPNSIAVHGHLVYVLNALGGGTVQGYRIVSDQLVPLAGSSRALGLNPNATPQFTTVPGDIAFTPDGRSLLVTTKANGNDIDVFGVDPSGVLSASPVVNSEPGLVPFALAFEPGDQVAVAEAGPSDVQTFALGSNGVLAPIDSVATGQAATCWIAADGPLLFTGNAGSGTESRLVDLFGSLSVLGATNTDAGTVDGAVSPDGRFLYVQTGAAGIVDEFRVGFGGTLTEIGSVPVPNGVGDEGIATS